jgi:hypothetical protein
MIVSGIITTSLSPVASHVFSKEKSWFMTSLCVLLRSTFETLPLLAPWCRTKQSTKAQKNITTSKKWIETNHNLKVYNYTDALLQQADHKNIKNVVITISHQFVQDTTEPDLVCTNSTPICTSSIFLLSSNNQYD